MKNRKCLTSTIDMVLTDLTIVFNLKHIWNLHSFELQLSYLFRKDNEIV